MNDTRTTADELRTLLDRRWWQLTLIAWVGIAAWFVVQQRASIYWLALGDTDDNMRLMQVRALLNGQGWYDLRQYRLDPPAGFNIHWSRIVDLPLAGLILLFRLFVSPVVAEKWACGVAPLLPLSVALIGLGATVRRLISPYAWPFAIVFLLCAPATLPMFMPERIDHHGWQLACLSLTVAGLCDPKGRRGGVLVGLSSAVSLSIGLELLPYAAMAGAITALRWVWDRADAPRLAAYAVTLAGGSTLGFALFASNANQVLRCDALTPVWLSVMIVAGALLFVLARINPEGRALRLGLAAAAGVVIVVGFALLFPQCLGRPEQVSPELARTWLNNVREAKPIYKHPLANALLFGTLPLVGLIGAVLGILRARGTPQFIGWAGLGLFALFAAAMMFWQVRAGAAAQLLAVPGSVALVWILVPWCRAHSSVAVRVLGTAAVVVAASGLFVGYAIPYLPKGKADKQDRKRTALVNRAGRLCTSLPPLKALDRLPPQTIFTFVDLGPRLITVTHHNAVAGPYHRNGGAILDVQHAFSRSPDNFRETAKRHGATLLLVCPNMAESTIYRARNPGGFYDQLAHNKVPGWLEPVPLPRRSPFRLWRIK